MDTANAQQEPEVIEAEDVGDLVQPLPEVNTAAIDAAQEQEAEATAQASAPAPTPAPAAPPLAASAAAPTSSPAAKPQRTRVAVTDEKGRPFDPLLHECTDDGQPIMRSAPNDRYVRCRRQPLKEWKRKSVVADEAAPPQAEAPTPAPTPVVDPAKQLVAAQTMSGLQLMAMRVALGNKLGEEEAEREELTNAWLGVLQHYGVGGSFHPVVGLALVSGGLVVGALKRDPDTRSRLTKAWHWAQRKALSVWQLLGGRRRSKAWATSELDPSMSQA